MVAISPSADMPTARDGELVVMTICRSSDSSMLTEALRIAESVAQPLPLAAYSALLSKLRADWKAAVRLMRAVECLAVPAAPLSSHGDHNSSLLVEMYQRVIEACAHAGEAEPAYHSLLSCLQKGLSPSVDAYELVISSLSKRLQWRRAMQVLERMRDTNRLPTLTSFNCILTAMSKAREAGPALSLLSTMKQRYPTIQPNIYTYNNVLAATASNSRYSKQALQVFDQCQRQPGLTPDVYSFSNAIRACAKSGQTSRALTLLQVVKDKGLPVDAYCYTAAMEACSKARMWEKALELMNEMQDEYKLVPSAVAFSLCISACGNAGKWQAALDLLERMRHQGLRANLITYNSAITALSRSAARRNSQEASLWPHVQHLMRRMRDEGLQPDGFSYSAAISCCGAEGKWEEALGLIAEMQGSGTRPNKVAYSAAISCCGKNGQVDHALRLFQEMSDQGIVADRVAYNAVFSALRVGKRSDTAYGLWRSMIGQRQRAVGPVRKPGHRTAALSDATPDIITVTEAVAAISADGSAASRDRVDEVFRDAFDRQLVLRSNLDSTWDFDLSGLPLPVARAACRFILGRIALTSSLDDVSDLTLITGVGVNHRRQLSGDNEISSGQTSSSERDISLRDFVQHVLASDFDPPLSSEIPSRAQGSVLIPGAVLRAYLRNATEPRPGSNR
jgi:pentatricopeptide repeat domain-containing protein 1